MFSCLTASPNRHGSDKTYNLIFRILIRAWPGVISWLLSQTKFTRRGRKKPQKLHSGWSAGTAVVASARKAVFYCHWIPGKWRRLRYVYCDWLTSGNLLSHRQGDICIPEGRAEQYLKIGSGRKGERTREIGESGEVRKRAGNRERQTDGRTELLVIDH